MSLAVPSALLLAVFAAPIIVFYILKVRLRRVPVSTNMFWKQIYDEKPPRSIWQYLRHLLSLLAQLFVLALLVLAVADPYLPWQLLQSRRIVTVIDNSASMRARDIAPTRFDAAIQSALDLVDGLRFRDELAIVIAGPSPEVVVGMSGHVPTLKRTLREIEPSDNPTNLTSAVRLGEQLLGEHPRGQVVVFTDGCVDSQVKAIDKEKHSAVASAQPPMSDEPNIDYHIFATPVRNVGITQFQVRRSLIDSVGYEALVCVQNASDREVACRLEIELDNVPVDVLPLKLKPEEKWNRSLQKTSLEGGRLTAKLTQIGPPDAVELSTPGRSESETAATPIFNALPTDDTAWAILPERKIQKVLLVTEGNLFLQKVLEANPQVHVEIRSTIPEQWPADTLVVLHRAVPEQLPPGNVTIVDPTGGCDDWELGEILENPIVTQQDKDSPLMTHVRLDNVLMPEARKLVFKEAPQVLAGTLSGDPVYAAIKRERGKCLVLTVNLDRGDLAFRTAFPIMVTNALSWFAGAAGELRPSVATGAVTEVALDDTVTRGDRTLLLRSPSGRQTPLADQMAVAPPDASENLGISAPKSLTVGPLDECGVWRLVSQESPERETELVELAVNLANARESDLRPVKEFAAEDSTKPRLAGWLSRPLWYYVLLCACAATVAEWFMYQRRVIT